MKWSPTYKSSCFEKHFIFIIYKSNLCKSDIYSLFLTLLKHYLIKFTLNNFLEQNCIYIFALYWVGWWLIKSGTNFVIKKLTILLENIRAKGYQIVE